MGGDERTTRERELENLRSVGVGLHRRIYILTEQGKLEQAREVQAAFDRQKKLIAQKEQELDDLKDQK